MSSWRGFGLVHVLKQDNVSFCTHTDHAHPRGSERVHAGVDGAHRRGHCTSWCRAVVQCHRMAPGHATLLATLFNLLMCSALLWEGRLG